LRNFQIDPEHLHQRSRDVPLDGRFLTIIDALSSLRAKGACGGNS
jgi:hypothetical protein